jgi:hypothetical protein
MDKLMFTLVMLELALRESWDWFNKQQLICSLMMACTACGLEIQLIHNKLSETQTRTLTALIHSFLESVLTKHGSEFSLIMLLLKIGGSRMTLPQVMLTSKLWQQVVLEICISSLEKLLMMSL